MSDTNDRPGFQITLDPSSLRPIIQEVVKQVLEATERDRQETEGRLAYNEAEAAHLLGLESWQLRDERRRGRISASTIVGRRIRYLKSDLINYLACRRHDTRST